MSGPSVALPCDGVAKALQFLSRLSAHTQQLDPVVAGHLIFVIGDDYLGFLLLPVNPDDAGLNDLLQPLLNIDSRELGEQ